MLSWREVGLKPIAMNGGIMSWWTSRIRIHILTSVLHKKTEKSQTYDKEMTINKFEPGTGFPVSGLFRYMVLKPAFYLIKFLPAWQNTF